MRRLAAVALVSSALACKPQTGGAPSFALENLGPAACPRDASVGAGGRCVCARDRVPLLGACVDPTLGDAYCGPSAHVTLAGSCAFRACAEGEALDADGACRPWPSVVRTQPGCVPASVLVVDGGRTACVPPDASCPRGAKFDAGTCVAAPSCPPGSLISGSRCVPVVLRGQGGSRLVDVGTWAALVLGPSGGPGSAELCRPLAARPAALGLEPGKAATVAVSARLVFPDQDVSRVYAELGPGAPVGTDDMARQAVDTLLEPLRALGGRASAASVDVELGCAVSWVGR